MLALLPCHSVTPAMLLFDLCLMGLFWACYMFSLCLIPVAWYYHWASIHAILGFLGPFHRFRVSLDHFISLGILSPFHFLGYPWPIQILHSHEFSQVSWASSIQITIFFTFEIFHQPFTHLIHYFGPLWPILACFLFLLMPMSLLLLSLDSFGFTCFLWGPFAIS